MLIRGKNITTVIKRPNAGDPLGKTETKDMGLVMRVNETNNHPTTEVFREILLLNCGPVMIELFDNDVPSIVNMPCRVPFLLFLKVEKKLKRMFKIGIIEKVTTPKNWCAPPKCNLEKIRDSV